MNGVDASMVRELVARHGKDGDALRATILKMGEAAVKPLLAALDDESAPIRAIALSLLGEIGDRHAVAPLVHLLQNEAPRARKAAPSLRERIALRLCRDLRALEAQAAEDERALDRRFAAHALGKLGDPRAVEPLKALRDDPNAHVRAAAHAQLGAA